MLSEEDLEFRRSRIGASDAAAIMGVSKWHTPYQKWLEKMGLLESQSNAATKRGEDLEPLALAEFERQTGIPLMGNRRVINPHREWQFATLDGVSINGDVIVEIKCASKEVHEMARNKKIPEWYFPQVQHQLDVCNLDRGFYFSFNGKEGLIVEVKRDQEYIDMMVEEEHKFLTSYMLTQEAPPLCERDLVTRNDRNWISLTDEFLKCSTKLKELEKRREEIRQELIVASQGKNSSGNGVRVTRVPRKGSVDYEIIPELKGVDLNTYRRPPSDSWRVAENSKN